MCLKGEKKRFTTNIKKCALKWYSYYSLPQHTYTQLYIYIYGWCPWCNGYTATRVQILDLTDCISHSTNTLGKGMNPNILPPAMGK